MARALVISPHFDDAVLSAWSALSAGEADVLNVCGGEPPAGAVGVWDRVTGATDSVARTRERVAEDREALAVAGVRPRTLAFLDDQYREEPLSLGELGAALEAEVDGAGGLYAPAGLGGHADHVAVRDVTLALGAERGLAVFLYAELPYATRFGWPHWVTGREPQENLAPEERWEVDLATLPCPRDRLRPHVRELSDDEAERKLAALRLYRTQFPALEAVGQLSRPEVSRWEVHWEVRPPA